MYIADHGFLHCFSLCLSWRGTDSSCSGLSSSQDNAEHIASGIEPVFLSGHGQKCSCIRVLKMCFSVGQKLGADSLSFLYRGCFLSLGYLSYDSKPTSNCLSWPTVHHGHWTGELRPTRLTLLIVLWAMKPPPWPTQPRYPTSSCPASVERAVGNSAACELGRILVASQFRTGPGLSGSRNKWEVGEGLSLKTPAYQTPWNQCSPAEVCTRTTWRVWSNPIPGLLQRVLFRWIWESGPLMSSQVTLMLLWSREHTLRTTTLKRWVCTFSGPSLDPVCFKTRWPKKFCFFPTQPSIWGHLLVWKWRWKTWKNKYTKSNTSYWMNEFPKCW